MNLSAGAMMRPLRSWKWAATGPGLQHLAWHEGVGISTTSCSFPRAARRDGAQSVGSGGLQNWMNIGDHERPSEDEDVALCPRFKGKRRLPMGSTPNGLVSPPLAIPDLKLVARLAAEPYPF